MNKKTSVTLVVVIVIAIIIWIIAMAGGSKDVTTTPTDSFASVAISSVTNSDNTASAASAFLSNKTITWTVEGYPKNAGININLLRKTSDSPATYELVRTIAENTANDGSETWQPEASDGSDLYVEVTCSTSYEFEQGCAVTGSPIKVQ